MVNASFPHKAIADLKSAQLKDATEVLAVVASWPFVVDIMLGGSFTRDKSNTRSDIDLFVLYKGFTPEIADMSKRLGTIENLSVIIYQGFFPWTQDLFTVYFNSDPDFSVDLCMIDETTKEHFFWEPKGVSLSDTGIIQQIRSNQMKEVNYKPHPFLRSNVFELSIISLKKISKNLERNHIWNSIEQLSIFRRYIMQIVRVNLMKDLDFLGRVDRDIEDVIPSIIQQQLLQSLPIYKTDDVAKKTLLLIQLFENLIDEVQPNLNPDISKWISRQLSSESKKLNSFLLSAITRHESFNNR